MQVYALRMFNFLRFGEKNNSIVFDLTDEQKKDINSGTITIDQIYDQIMLDPKQHISNVKKMEVKPLLGIIGISDGDEKKSNGVGKSTCLEGISYAHFGKIVRLSANNDKTGDPGNSIITRINGDIAPNITESYVEELFEINNRFFVVKRGRAISKSRKSISPILEFREVKGLELHSQMGHRTSDTMSSIEEVNDISFDLFASSQMFGQNDSGKFLTGTDKTKKEMIIALLKQEDQVKSINKLLKEKIYSLNKELDFLKGNIAFSEKQILQSYEKNTSLKRIDIGSDILTSFNLKMKDDISNWNCKIGEIDLTLKDLIAKIHDCQKNMSLQDLEKMNSDISTFDQEIISLEKNEKETMSGLRLDLEKINTRKKNLADKVATINQKIIKSKEDISSYDNFTSKFDLKSKQEILAKCEKAKTYLTESNSDLESIRKLETEFSAKIFSINSEISKANSEIKKLKKNAESNKEIFSCEECGSEVPLTHLTDKISIKNKEIELKNNLVKENQLLLDEQKTKKQEIATKQNLINSKYISQEVAINNEINSYNSKLDLSEIIKKSLNDLVLESESLVKELSLVTTESEEFVKKGKETKEKLSEGILLIRFKRSEIKTKKDNILAENEGKKAGLALIEKNRDQLDKEKQQISQTVGSLMKEMEYFKDQYDKYNVSNSELSVKSDLMSKYASLQLVFGLDGIQTRIVKKYLPLLNHYVEEYLSILSNNEIKLKFSVDEKSEVVMKVEGGTSDQYSMLSGGEKMIIRLAVDIGLSLLSFVRSSQKPEMIFLDEIFGPLDESRTASVFKMLNKLQDVFKRVVLITHNSAIKSMIENNIIVEKNSHSCSTSEIKIIV